MQDRKRIPFPQVFTGCICTLLAACLQRVFVHAAVVEASTRVELRNLLNGGTPHILVTRHLDVRGFADAVCSEPFCVTTFTHNESVPRVSVRGFCTDAYTDPVAGPVTLPPLSPQQCVLRIDKDMIYVRRKALWLHNLHVLVQDRSEAIVRLVRVGQNGRVYMTSVGLQSDRKQSQLILLQSSNAFVMFADGFLGDTTYEPAPKALPGPAVGTNAGDMALINVKIERAVSTGNSTGAIHTWGSTGRLMCQDCVFDEASDPPLSSAGGSVVFADDLAVFNNDTQAFEASRPVRNALWFSSDELLTIQKEAGYTPPAPPPPASPPPPSAIPEPTAEPPTRSLTPPPVTTASAPEGEGVPGEPPSPQRRARRSIAGGVTAAAVALLVIGMLIWFVLKPNTRKPSRRRLKTGKSSAGKASLSVLAANGKLFDPIAHPSGALQIDMPGDEKAAADPSTANVATTTYQEFNMFSDLNTRFDATTTVAAASVSSTSSSQVGLLARAAMMFAPLTNYGSSPTAATASAAATTAGPGSTAPRPLHSAQLSNSSGTGLHPPIRPGSTMDVSDRFARLHSALDELEAAGELLFGKYTLLGRQERRQGGQGLVQFVLQGRLEQHAVKFFLQWDAFEHESMVFQHEKLSHMLFSSCDVQPNTDGRWTSPSGYVFPPSITVERGQSLNEWLATINPSRPTVVDAVVNVAERLAILHDSGYAHRDIKPGNLMRLEKRWGWVMIDFGCVAQIGYQAPLSFTWKYAAPETIKAFEAQQETVVAASAVDMWALGVICFEMLTQKPLFKVDDSKEHVRACLAGRLPLPWEDEEIRESLLSELRNLKDLVLRCLNRVPGERPSAQEFRAELMQLF